MKYAIIENGVVINIAVADAPLAANWIAGAAARIGDTWDGEAFAPPAPAANALQSERATMVCSRFQARVALRGNGTTTNLLPQVEAIIAEADDLTKLAWAEVIEFRRNSPMIIALGAALELTDAQVDDLFRAAMQIEV